MNIKSYKLVLGAIVFSFFLRGVFIAAVFPIFRGQDESRHYNTIQYLAGNEVVDCSEEVEQKQIKRDLATYRYSDEIRAVATLSQIKKVRGSSYDKVVFERGSVDAGGEAEFKLEEYSKEQHRCPPDIAFSALNSDNLSLYHKLLVPVERLLSGKNIFVRYYILRIISVLFGSVVILLAYYIFRNIGLNEKHSLLLTAILSFQPKLCVYFTNINYDSLLILLWTAFILVGTIILRRGWSATKAVVLLFIIVASILTKPSALPLIGLALFLFWRAPKKEMLQWKISRTLKSLIIILVVLITFLLFQKVGVLKVLSVKSLSMLGIYLSDSLPKIYGSSRNYWGAISWNGDNWTMVYVVIIWLGEAFSWLGLFIWIIGPYLRKFIDRFTKVHLFEMRRGLILGAWIARTIERKKYFWFMLLSIVLLQMGIRVADWKVYVSSGSLVLGTPGRYWLPNIVPHFALLAMGWRVMIVKVFRKPERYFDLYLLMFLTLMILFWVYKVFDIIIPRFYL